MTDVADARNAVDMYTRGGPDMPETRGESMVQKHAEKLQKEKEESAMVVVRSAVDGLGPAVCTVALQECDWDGPKAILLLQRFKATQSEQLEALHKAKGKPNKTQEGSSGASSTSASGSEDSASDSDKSVEATRHKKTKSSKRKNKKDKKKKEKTSKKRKRKTKHSANQEAQPVVQYGKYGIVRESDFQAKRADFACWAFEVKKIDPEVLPKFEEKDLFKTYIEDFNTGTLPHKKYYDVQAYEQKQAARAYKKRKAAVGGERLVFNDEDEKTREQRAARAAAQAERLKQAYDELKYTDKAQDMKEQELLRMKMSLAYKTGDHATAEKLAERLRPDDGRDTRRDREPIV